ncbi:MAG: MBL fold metallo-hydrolase [Clostridiales bacterium]|nr:MBL fold metallo-hydrolase [Lachnospiraceae bacterium]MCD8110219.1 MBL fold metallo-hydrolase [Clostridiales bacterium]MCD8133405.1 MBL fold metallo-hydrolase [Clostridiales bacterium]
MADLQVLEYNVGDIGTNCYLLVNTATKETIIVDPGGDAPMLERHITAQGLQPVAVFLTHAHYDHAHHARKVKETYQIPVYVHEDEKETMRNPRINVSSMFGCPESYEADVFVKDGERLEVAGFDIRVLHTPGHTAGGVCYYFPENKTLISGDALFNGSVGRTDFPGGSMSMLVRSIREKLLVLPRDTEVYPGHMSKTTIGYEADYNPFL